MRDSRCECECEFEFECECGCECWYVSGSMEVTGVGVMLDTVESLEWELVLVLVLVESLYTSLTRSFSSPLGEQARV